jgi:hypothetical protein
MLIYSPEERAYGVIVHNGTTRWIAFCPWCGTDLNETSVDYPHWSDVRDDWLPGDGLRNVNSERMSVTTRPPARRTRRRRECAPRRPASQQGRDG